MDKNKKIIIGVIIIILALVLLILMQQPNEVNLDGIIETQSPYIVYAEEESMQLVAGGGYTYITLFSNGDGNYLSAVSVGCEITPFTMSSVQVENIQTIINTNKLYDDKCLKNGGTDYYVKYVLSDGEQQYFTGGINWITDDCKQYFDQINNIIYEEVVAQKENMYYSENCEQ
jgi:hypothetical protein